MQEIGVVDEPVQGIHEDALDIKMHTNALTHFITTTRTPMAIGIQGEWGSGKTSLINGIYQNLDTNPEIKQIWINSWEHSLLCSPEESLLKIIKSIIEELLECDPEVSKKESIKKGVESVFKGALRVGAFAVGGSGASDLAKEFVGEKHIGIGNLREQLASLVRNIETRSSNPIKRIVVYVDDLDRIEPKNAVAILELLKNIFSLPNCIFVLAIDYQVVVKGLEHKFGKQNDSNEWEFRAFFDKIIQLPFMMPMGQYNIGRYVNSLLLNVGFTNGEGFDETAIREIVLRSVGGNPRSLKRLINSVSLIKLFSEEKYKETSIDANNSDINEETQQLLIFALLCLQIAYPYLYTLLMSEPSFDTWDENLALKETLKAEENSPEFLKEFNFVTSQGEDFDEEWEQCLYRLCYLKPRLKARVSDISKFFSYLKDDVLADFEDSIGEIISDILAQTSVTNVTSTDAPQTNLPVKEKYKVVKFDNFEIYKQQVLEPKKIQPAVIKKIEHIINHACTVVDGETEVTYAATEINIKKANAKGRRKVFLYLNFRKTKIYLQFTSGYEELMSQYPEGAINYYKNFSLEVTPSSDISVYDPLFKASFDAIPEV